MTLALRLILGTGTTVAAYWLLIIAFAFFPILHPSGLRLLSGGLALALGVAVAWASAPDAPLRLWAIARTALKSGLICFALGFFGPMILAPDANQGPLLGFFAAPAGLVAGGLYAFVRELCRGRDAAR